VDLVFTPRRRVVFFQAFAEVVGVHANQGVLLRVEAGVAAEDVEANAILRDVALQALKRFLAEVDQQAGKFGRALEGV